MFSAGVDRKGAAGGKGKGEGKAASRLLDT